MVEQQCFKIEITYPAEKRFQEEILAYLVENFSLERASEIVDNITASVASLSTIPERKLRTSIKRISTTI
ncbi:MAG: hypothetical protein CO022_10445 [Flavobacteriales bacterium CG_4_9_14_0_2_um_filter_32_27]|nr:hypothetical protein [Bacteroidota bacterium]PJC61366.1 MAG: hypothetical protein CO022_10445 [Flavobacteriales bacterium CG_4_9_14_0_2_um_filter_32_27]